MSATDIYPRNVQIRFVFEERVSGESYLPTLLSTFKHSNYHTGIHWKQITRVELTYAQLQPRETSRDTFCDIVEEDKLETVIKVGIFSTKSLFLFIVYLFQIISLWLPYYFQQFQTWFYSCCFSDTCRSPGKLEE